jgi:hypothetical protein
MYIIKHTNERDGLGSTPQPDEHFVLCRQPNKGAYYWADSEEQPPNSQICLYDTQEAAQAFMLANWTKKGIKVALWSEFSQVPRWTIEKQ